MTPTQRNLLGNLASQGLILALGLTCLPAIVRLVGVEAYGLAGLSWTFQSVATALDFGWGTTTNRELARLSSMSDSSPLMRAIVNRLGGWYLLAAVVVMVTAWFAGPQFGRMWLRPRELTDEQLTVSLRMIGVVIALQVPTAFYSSCAMGLQRIVPLSVIRSLTATVSFLGAVALLAFWSRSITCFLAVQIVASAGQLIATYGLVRLALPTSAVNSPSTGIDWLRLRRFAAGVFGISLAGLLLSHGDKVLLSKLLVLDEFGYYAVASMIATGLLSLAQPLFSVALPRFAQFAGMRQDRAIELLYHQMSQLLGVLLIPLGTTLAILPEATLLVWTGNPAVVTHAVEMLRWLAIGSTLIGLANIPYALQLAHGWTQLSLIINVIAVLTILPLMAILADRYGGVGAGVAWAALGGGYVLVSVPIMHRRLLRGAWGSWLINGVLAPFIPSLITLLAARIGMSATTRTQAALVLFIALMGAYATSFICTPSTREWACRLFLLARPANQKHPPREVT